MRINQNNEYNCQPTTDIANNGSQNSTMIRWSSSDLQMNCGECEEKGMINDNIQAKIEIGAQNAEYDQEADSVADKLMMMPLRN